VVVGNLHLDEITRGLLAAYASARMKADAKGATIRRDLATLSRLLLLCRRVGLCDINPVRLFRKWDADLMLTTLASPYISFIEKPKSLSSRTIRQN
jgi:hypothetical protein